MAVRIKDWMIPYTGGIGIEITNNHVINVLLREMNNLIHYTGEDDPEYDGPKELYVDLQLPAWITPEDNLPVGVTTGKILQADWWQQSGIILNWKTTSWDYVRLIYANDGKLYYDPWTWTWIEIWGSGGSVWVATASTLGTIKLGSDTQQTVAAQTPSSTADRTYAVQLNSDNQAVVNVPWENTTYTAWANIVIDNDNVISTTIPQALVYKWNVNDISDLPSSWQSVGDTYFVEWEDAMYSWDGNQWNYVGWTGIDVSDLFNKTTDNSDDIVQWTTNLFVTQAEKDLWNSKQDHLTAWDGIDITNNVVSNTAKFDPSNAGSLGQFLKKTNDGYAWADIPWGWVEYTAWDWIDITNNVISATDRFTPTNQWNVGQVLKKSGANSYYWANESGWGSWNFNPENAWTPWQVLTKTQTWYAWITWAWGGSNVKCFELNLVSYTQEEIGDIVGWVNTGTDYWAIIKVEAQDDVFLYHEMKVLSWKTEYYFLWMRYYADTTTSVNWQFSTLYNQWMKITYENGEYTISDYSLNAYANFLKVEDSWYTTPYMPTAPYQPTTKAYVDSRNWTWTLSQYNALTEIDPDVVYNITSLN